MFQLLKVAIPVFERLMDQIGIANSCEAVRSLANSRADEVTLSRLRLIGAATPR